MKKLTLNKETLRSLDPAETNQIDGAWVMVTVTCNTACRRTVMICLTTSRSPFIC